MTSPVPNRGDVPDSNAFCTFCGKDWRGMGFACLSGSTFEGEDEDGIALLVDDSRSYLHIAYHGPETGPGHPYASLALVDAHEGGGFDLYFCSTACLRKWFSAAVDRLEEEYQGQKPQQP